MFVIQLKQDEDLFWSESKGWVKSQDEASKFIHHYNAHWRANLLCEQNSDYTMQLQVVNLDPDWIRDLNSNDENKDIRVRVEMQVNGKTFSYKEKWIRDMNVFPLWAFFKEVQEMFKIPAIEIRNFASQSKEQSECSVSKETVDKEALMAAAKTLEKAIGEIANGRLKPGKLPLEELVTLIQGVKNLVQ